MGRVEATFWFFVTIHLLKIHRIASDNVEPFATPRSDVIDDDTKDYRYISIVKDDNENVERYFLIKNTKSSYGSLPDHAVNVSACRKASRRPNGTAFPRELIEKKHTRASNNNNNNNNNVVRREMTGTGEPKLSRNNYAPLRFKQKDVSKERMITAEDFLSRKPNLSVRRDYIQKYAPYYEEIVANNEAVVMKKKKIPDSGSMTKIAEKKIVPVNSQEAGPRHRNDSEFKYAPFYDKDISADKYIPDFETESLEQTVIPEVTPEVMPETAVRTYQTVSQMQRYSPEYLQYFNDFVSKGNVHGNIFPGIDHTFKVVLRDSEHPSVELVPGHIVESYSEPKPQNYSSDYADHNRKIVTENLKNNEQIGEYPRIDRVHKTMPSDPVARLEQPTRKIIAGHTIQASKIQPIDYSSEYARYYNNIFRKNKERTTSELPVSERSEVRVEDDVSLPENDGPEDARYERIILKPMKHIGNSSATDHTDEAIPETSLEQSMKTIVGYRFRHAISQPRANNSTDSRDYRNNYISNTGQTKVLPATITIHDANVPSPELILEQPVGKTVALFPEQASLHSLENNSTNMRYYGEIDSKNDGRMKVFPAIDPTRKARPANIGIVLEGPVKNTTAMLLKRAQLQSLNDNSTNMEYYSQIDPKNDGQTGVLPAINYKRKAELTNLESISEAPVKNTTAIMPLSEAPLQPPYNDSKNTEDYRKIDSKNTVQTKVFPAMNSTREAKGPDHESILEQFIRKTATILFDRILSHPLDSFTKNLNNYNGIILKNTEQMKGSPVNDSTMRKTQLKNSETPVRKPAADYGNLVGMPAEERTLIKKIFNESKVLRRTASVGCARPGECLQNSNITADFVGNNSGKNSIGTTETNGSSIVDIASTMRPVQTNSRPVPKEEIQITRGDRADDGKEPIYKILHPVITRSFHNANDTQQDLTNTSTRNNNNNASTGSDWPLSPGPITCELDYPVHTSFGVRDEEYDYVVFLQLYKYEGGSPREHICTGVLLDKRHVLVAAHCTHNHCSECNLIVYFGNDLCDHSRRITAGTVVEHEHYNDVTRNHDLSLVQLEEETVRVPATPSRADVIGETFLSVGFGEFLWDNHKGNLTKIKQKLPMIRHPAKKDESAWTIFVTSGTDLTGTTRGDFGGALLSSTGELVGLQSLPPTRGRNYEIYTNLQSYFPWIRRKILVNKN